MSTRGKFETGEIKKAFQEEIGNLRKSFEATLTAMEENFIKKLNLMADELDQIRKKQEDTSAACIKLKQENNRLQLELDRIEQASHERKLILGGEALVSFLEKSKEDLRDSSESFLEKVVGVDVRNINILHVARLGHHNKEKPDRRPLLIEVDDTFSKSMIFRKVIDKKQKSLYVSEFLTKRRKKILESLLSLKRSNPTKIHRVYSKHGSVCILMADSLRPRVIKDDADLDRCAKQLIMDLQ